jgi:hypothetical protein
VLTVHLKKKKKTGKKKHTHTKKRKKGAPTVRDALTGKESTRKGERGNEREMNRSVEYCRSLFCPLPFFLTEGRKTKAKAKQYDDANARAWEIK